MVSSFPQRLKSARVRAGLSLRELAGKLGGNLTAAAICKYEKGQAAPGSARLIELSGALGVPVDYFFRPVSLSLDGMEFRKCSRLSKTEEKRIRELACDFLERYTELEGLLGIDETSGTPRPATVVSNSMEAAAAAAALRQTWGMGLGPVNDLFGLLEEKGFKVLEVDADPAFSGLTAAGAKYALIVVNRAHDAVRKRFTAAHELGHLVLQPADGIADKDREKLCHAFAGAFLLPPEVIREEIGQHRQQIAMGELVALKANYGISIQAIAAQLRGLGIVTDGWYRQFNVTVSARGWRQAEPGAYVPHEQLRRFLRLVIRAVSEEIISASKAAGLADMTLDDLRKELMPTL
jgi:Zn-dependent peptidase ImmA (M78 family)/transcriptional regulator with XRE-family HTH domain